VRFIAVTQGLGVKPNGDAMSLLILTVLSGVAEFERALISERTALAARAARQAGRAWGRRPRPYPPFPQVRRWVTSALEDRMHVPIEFAVHGDRRRSRRAGAEAAAQCQLTRRTRSLGVVTRRERVVRND